MVQIAFTENLFRISNQQLRQKITVIEIACCVLDASSPSSLTKLKISFLVGMVFSSYCLPEKVHSLILRMSRSQSYVALSGAMPFGFQN
jgi:hypothetical protein